MRKIAWKFSVGATLLSLFLIAAIAVHDIAFSDRYLGVFFNDRDRKISRVGLAIAQHRIWFTYWPEEQPEQVVLNEDGSPGELQPIRLVHWLSFDSKGAPITSTDSHFGGFSRDRVVDWHTKEWAWTTWSVPSWSVMTLLGVPSMLVLLLWRKKRRRAKRIANNLCVLCGYDLRASPGRCPECGRIQGAITALSGPSDE